MQLQTNFLSALSFFNSANTAEKKEWAKTDAALAAEQFMHACEGQHAYEPTLRLARAFAWPVNINPEELIFGTMPPDNTGGYIRDTKAAHRAAKQGNESVYSDMTKQQFREAVKNRAKLDEVPEEIISRVCRISRRENGTVIYSEKYIQMVLAYLK